MLLARTGLLAARGRAVRARAPRTTAVAVGAGSGGTVQAG
jgi:hypothetical protein